MSTILRLTAFVSIAALALFAAMSAGATNPHATYTCTKVKHNGDTEVKANVPDSAVGGLTQAGYTCVANEDDEQGAPSGSTASPTCGRRTSAARSPASAARAACSRCASRRIA